MIDIYTTAATQHGNYLGHSSGDYQNGKQYCVSWVSISCDLLGAPWNNRFDLTPLRFENLRDHECLPRWGAEFASNAC